MVPEKHTEEKLNSHTDPSLSTNELPCSSNSSNRHESIIATYIALYGRPEIVSEIIRDTGLY